MGFEYQIKAKAHDILLPLGPLAQALLAHGVHIIKQDVDHIYAVFKLPSPVEAKCWGEDIYAERLKEGIYLMVPVSRKQLEEMFPTIVMEYKNQHFEVRIEEL